MPELPFQGVRDALQSALRRRNRMIVPYDLSVQARRAKLARHAGCESLIDIGANIGQWSSEVRIAGWTGPIWSFEPLSTAYDRLAQRAALDPEWHVRKVAVGAEAGSADINVSEDTVYSSLAPMTAASTRANPQAAYVAVEKVEVDTLDHLAADVAGAVGVKIDVQGFESKVMDGGEATLRVARFLEVELSLVPCYDDEPLYQEMLDRITGYGFRLALVEPVWADQTTGEALQFNGLFVRR
jgi:FkbM family methyltransferase